MSVKYRIFCNTDDRYEYIWDVVPPTTCPINASHSVDSTSIKSVGQEYFRGSTPPTNVRKYNKLTEYIPPIEKNKVLTVDETNEHLTWQYPHTHRIRNFTFGMTNYTSKKDPVGSGIIKNTEKNSTVTSVVGAFIFDGTDNDDTISNIKVIAFDPIGELEDNPVIIKIKLMEGITQIAELSIDNEVTPINMLTNGGNIVATSTITNLPTTESVIQIQLELVVGNKKGNFYVGITQIIISR